MAKYIAKHHDKPVSGISVDGQEYSAKEGKIEIPESHPQAHKEMERLGFKKAE